MASEKVHRPLLHASPMEKGPDVKALQGSINKQFKDMNIDLGVKKDGEFGGQTWDKAKKCANCMGVTGEAQKKLKKGRLSEGTQKLIRGRKPTKKEQKAAKKRKKYREDLRKQNSDPPGQEAVAKGRNLLGVHEEPAGSNWGKKVGEFITYTGYSGPVYWCGCYACWVVCKLGGAKIPTRIRMGYAPYITADAKAGKNGFHAVNIHDAKPGDVVCMWGGQHIEVVAQKPSGGSIRCIGGNTSQGGKYNNGGEVCENTRSISDIDSGIAARPNWS
jgi:hypothetical protein